MRPNAVLIFQLTPRRDMVYCKGMPAVNVAFLGPVGTHSHEACLRRFGTRFRPRPCRTLREVFEALAGADAAVVPIENALEGPVTQTLDLLVQRTTVVVREAFDMPIHNHLAARPDVAALHDVKVVYSHPQALGQCEQWLHAHLPHADFVPVASTAEAARRAASEKRTAAVAGQVALDIHRLRILHRDIQDMAANATRFFLLASPHAPTAPLPAAPRTAGRPQARTLLHLVLHDRPGALLNGLKPFDRQHLNLSFIQSRPLPGRPWEYGFFLEVTAPGGAPALRRATADLAAHTQVCRVIGSYACFGLGGGKTRQV
jgi:chorismate mutase/prephenate dehydratase